GKCDHFLHRKDILAMLYLDYYKLNAPPFQLGPDPRFYFASQGHRRAMAFLTYGLHQEEGFLVISGEVGAGKTTLIKRLLAELDPAEFVVGLVPLSHYEPQDMLRRIAETLGISDDGPMGGPAGKAALTHRIEETLRETRRSGRRVLLVFDEAQTIPPATLEELRTLGDLQEGARSLMQCLLIGQPSFRDTLLRPDMTQFQQRVIAFLHLGPFEEEDSKAYVLHRLDLAGWRGDPRITGEALQSIHDASLGIPRRINRLCSRLLVLGCLEELHVLDRAAVGMVAAELEQEATTGSGTSAITPHPASPPEDHLRAMAERLRILEDHVAMHERTISSALDLAVRYLHPEDGPRRRTGNG
ncbi:MAG TPA: AAA family ATPase, partial [Arenibaculum sp.]|nr:AAA family ATPase [Arenibaculum sp.]